MKKNCICAAVWLLAIGCAAAPVRGFSRADRAAEILARELLKAPGLQGTAAAAPFRSPDGGLSLLGARLADGITGRLARSGKVTALDRRYLARLLGELKLAASGAAEGGIEPGKLKDAKFLVLGSVEPSPGNRLVCSARLIETESGRVAAAARTVMPLDEETRRLYETPASADAAAEALFESRESSPRSLGRAGPSGCRWARAAASVKDGAAYARDAARSLAARLAAAAAAGRAPGKGNEAAPLADRLQDALSASTGLAVVRENFPADSAEDREYSITAEVCAREAAGAGGPEVALLLGARRLSPGETTRAALTVSAQASVYLYSVDLSGRASRLFPPPGRTFEAQPGSPVLFPGEGSAAGSELKAELPPGAAESLETLRAFALAPGRGDPLAGAAAYGDIISRLERAGRPWTEAAAVFEIRRDPPGAR